MCTEVPSSVKSKLSRKLHTKEIAAAISPCIAGREIGTGGGGAGCKGVGLE